MLFYLVMLIGTNLFGRGVDAGIIVDLFRGCFGRRRGTLDLAPWRIVRLETWQIRNRRGTDTFSTLNTRRRSLKNIKVPGRNSVHSKKRSISLEMARYG